MYAQLVPGARKPRSAETAKLSMGRSAGPRWQCGRVPVQETPRAAQAGAGEGRCRWWWGRGEPLPTPTRGGGRWRRRPSSAARAPKRALIPYTCAPHLEDSTASLGARFGGDERELGPAEWITTRDAPMLADSARRPADSARRAAGFAQSHSRGNAEEAGQLMRSGPRMPGEVVLLVPGFNSFRSPVAQKRSGDGEAKYFYGKLGPPLVPFTTTYVLSLYGWMKADARGSQRQDK